jgi:hypothetical protein
METDRMPTRPLLYSVFVLVFARCLLLSTAVHAEGPATSSAAATTSESQTNAANGNSPATVSRSEFTPSQHAETARLMHSDTTGTHWYGWQTLVVDTISLALIPAYGIGLIGYVLGTPIIHGLHGRAGSAVASVSMRLVLPLASISLWFSSCFKLDLSGIDLFGDGSSMQRSNSSSSDSPDVACTLLAALIVVGFTAPVAIDAAVLAREPVKAKHVSRITILPWASMSAGTGITVGARF